MIVETKKPAVLEFMSGFFDLRDSADFRGVLFVPDHFHGATASKEHVGVAYAWDNFVGRTCCISIVVQKPECLTREVIRAAFDFPFVKCGCNAVYATVDSNNTKSMDMCNRVGFKKVHVTPGGGRTGDLVIFEMLRSECRWLKKEQR